MITTQNIDRPPDLLDRMIGAAGARPSDQVTIAGGDIEWLLGLARRGYVHAECAVARGGGATDVLLIPAVATPQELATIMARLGRCLHHGGMAVIYLARVATRRRMAPLRRVLDAGGLALQMCSPCRDGTILAARKVGGAALLIAA